MFSSIRYYVTILKAIYVAIPDNLSRIRIVLWLILQKLFNKNLYSPKVSVGGKQFKIILRDINDLNAIVEIFLERCYAYLPYDFVPEKIIDLGANIGIATIWFLKEYPFSHIDAYEPNPEVFRRLQEHLGHFYSKVRLFQEAVSNKTGQEQLHLYDSQRRFLVGKLRYKAW